MGVVADEPSLSAAARFGRWLTIQRFVGILTLLVSLGWLGLFPSLRTDTAGDIVDEIYRREYSRRGYSSLTDDDMKPSDRRILMGIQWVTHGLTATFLITAIGLLYLKPWSLRTAFVASAAQLGVAVVAAIALFIEEMESVIPVGHDLMLDPVRAVMSAVLLSFVMMPSFREPFAPKVT